jgi:hypothetical protein
VAIIEVSAAMKTPSEEQLEKAYNEYALALGLVVHSSNRLQETLARLFRTIVGGDSRIVDAVWHSSKSDAAQRDMFRAALQGCTRHKWETRLPAARDDLIWLIIESDKFANKRNDAVHAPCLFTAIGTLAEVVAQQDTLNQKAKNLRDKKLLEEFQLYTKIACVLDSFATKAKAALVHHTVSWPEKPLMPTRGQLRGGA